MNEPIERYPFIPQWIVWVQCLCFSVLYSIWALPETILIRHICLITGALLSLWVIYQYRYSFFDRRAIPVWLIVTLFIWATFHLFFLSYDFAAQYDEYTSIWKRTAIGAIFGIGFGVALLAYLHKAQAKSKYLWILFYLGLIAPTVIYMVKYFLTSYGIQKGWIFSDWWRLYETSNPFYVPKTSYVCFCLPTLGIALGQLLLNINRFNFFRIINIVYIATIFGVFFVFYGQNDGANVKNGLIHSVILMTIFFVMLFFSNYFKNLFIKITMATLLLIMLSLFTINHFSKISSVQNFIFDTKIALNTESYDHWKYNGQIGYPRNDRGYVVSASTYERLAWGKIGLGLALENPLGYGLIERSFGQLAKIKWPDSLLHQSHSGWVDLSLGEGVPGVLLILMTVFILLKNLTGVNLGHLGNVSNLSAMSWWAVFSLLLLWCTTEVSQKIYFDNLIFWLSFAGGINLGLIAPAVSGFVDEKKLHGHSHEFC